MKIFKAIREVFWPLIDDEEITPPSEITEDDVKVNKENLKYALESVVKRYEEENERKKTIESKSSLFIGTISVVTTVVVAVTSVFVKEAVIDYTVCLLVFLLFILTIYMARTVWYSIQALERKNYHSLSVKDFLISGTEEEYQRKLIVDITNKLRKNNLPINCKVDSMVLAQEYFKRSIIIVVIYSFVLLLFFVSKSNASKFFENILSRISNIHLSTLNLVLLYGIGIVALFLAARANIKQKKFKK
jgi:hypothetical protein